MQAVLNTVAYGMGDQVRWGPWYEGSVSLVECEGEPDQTTPTGTGHTSTTASHR